MGVISAREVPMLLDLSYIDVYSELSKSHSDFGAARILRALLIT